MAHGGSVIAFIEDPDGYRIELIQRSLKSDEGTLIHPHSPHACGE